MIGEEESVKPSERCALHRRIRGLLMAIAHRQTG